MTTATEPNKTWVPTGIEGENVLTLIDIVFVVRKYLWLILAVVVLLSGATFGLSVMQTPRYVASTKILVGQDSGFVGNQGNVQQLEDLTQTMSQAVLTQPVAEEVIRQQELNLSPDALLGRLSADQIPNTQFVQVNYEDSDPKIAMLVADATGEVFTEQVSRVSPDVSAVTATVWEHAKEPVQPVSPNTLRNTAAALLVGTIIGFGLAFLLEYLDNSKKKAKVWDYQG